MPPAFSMASRAPLVAPMPLSVTALLISPDSTTFAWSANVGTMLAFFKASRSMTVPSILASSSRRTSARKAFMAERKPTLGMRRWMGIWPPSKPTLW